MTMHRLRDKNQDGNPKLIQQHIGNLREKNHQVSIGPTINIQNFKSPLRNKHKLKRHMFKSPIVHNNEPSNNLQIK